MQMNKTDLIKMVAEKANKPTKEVAEIIDSFFKELSQNLREKDVSIKDFGTFKKIIQPARIARNPATGEPVEVPEKEVVKYTKHEMAMIEINIHIPIDGVNNISIPIQLPVVPRVGEKIYLSDKQINNLISLLEEEYYHNPQTEEWKESIRRFTNIEEVAYNAANGTIHIELSTI